VQRILKVKDLWSLVSKIKPRNTGIIKESWLIKESKQIEESKLIEKRRAN